MTATISPIVLLDVATGKAVPAELLDAITEQQLVDYEGEWLPEQFKSLAAAQEGRNRKEPVAAESALGLAAQNLGLAGHVGESGVQCRV